VPKAKPDYVFGDIDLLKDVLMMIEMRIPGYLWGHAGTGKSTLPTQLCARLNRPIIRAQHTASTEESHICGQILVRGGGLISSQVFWQVQCVTGGFIWPMNMISHSANPWRLPASAGR
jgi:ABC-type phosphate transport system ATPase subunit